MLELGEDAGLAPEAQAAGMGIYHYTTLGCLPPIKEHGLKPAAALVLRTGEQFTFNVLQRMPSTVWFTVGEQFEPAAIPMVATAEGRQKWPPGMGVGTPRDVRLGRDLRVLTLEEHERDSGLARVEVGASAAPLTWQQWCERNAPALADRLAAFARDRGSDVVRWRASLDPVSPEAILGMDAWRNGAWIRVAWRTPDGLFGPSLT
jgi:hypothetical protein